MQVAHERLSLITTAESFREHASACTKALHLQNKYVKTGMLSVACASVVAMLMSKLNRKDEEQGLQLTRTVGIGRYVSAKLALGLLIPFLHKMMVGPADEAPMKKKRGFLRRIFSFGSH